MTMAAVIPVWNGRTDLERLLGSLERQTQPAGTIVAVDNGSTDGAAELARERGARVIAMGRNAGFAAAMNRGIAECLREGVEWIAALNSDVELAPDYLEKLQRAALESNAWFATGKLLDATHSSTPGRLDGTFDAVCRGGAAWRVGCGREDGPLFSCRRKIAIAPWTAVLFRAAAFERVGLLEERFESYLEDVDFGLRCAALGVDGIYEPAAAGRHKGSATLGRWHGETVRRMARNRIFLIARHYPGRLIWKWARPIAAAHLLWGGVALKHGRGLSWMRGVAQGVAGFRRVRRGAAPIPEKVLAGLLYRCEQSIREAQAATGWDLYWRWYFRLAGKEAGAGA